MKRSSAHFSGLLILLAVFTLLFLMDSAAEAQLFIWSGDGQTGKVGETLPILLIIQILQFGIPQPGVLVNFDITDPDGAFTRASFVTDAFGLAGNFFTFKTQAGTYTVTVFAPGREALLGSVTFILTAEAGPPALVEVSAFDLDRLSELDELPADGESIGLIAASITDAFENPIEDTTITWTISPSGSGEIGETEHSEGGLYGAFFTAGTVPGEIAIQARTPNGVVGTVTLTLTDAGGAPLTQISFPNQPPPRMAVGSTFEFRVIGADAANRTQNLSAADVNWAVTGGIGAVSTSGVFTAQTVGSGTVTATLKSNPTVQRESSTITVIAGPAANLAPSISTSNLAAGSNGTAALTMTVTDAFGNRVLTETITLTISPQNGSITSPATHVGNGVYEATYTAGAAAGEITIEAKTSNGITQNVALRLTEIIAVPTFELSIANTKLVPDQPGFPIVTVLTLQGKNGFNSSITFDIGTGLPDGVDVDLNPKEVSLTPESPASFVQLQLKLPDALAPGDYPFTISAFAADGTQFRRLTLTLEIEAPEVTPAILTAVLDPSTDIPLGGSHKLFGNLIVSEPPDDLALENLVIGLTLTAPSGATQNFEGKTDANGRYQLENPFNLDELGTWKLRTNFAGNEQLGASQSVPISFVVIQGISQLTFDTEPTGQLGTAIEVTGRLNPPLEGERLTLKIRRPDGAAFTLTDITTETLGVFRHMLKLEIGGDWEMTATWAGNDQYKDVTQTLTISVSEEVGRAIVVLGGGNRQDNPAWNTFNGLAEYVYNIFLKRFGGDAEQILFLSPDPSETNGANRDTTLNGLNLAITDWAKSQVNPQIPLFIYLLSHNLGEQFLLEKRGDSEARLSASLLAEWLAELPQGTPVTIIIEACHSGNFIRSADNQPTGLVGPDRTLIVSARGDKQARILNNLSSFSKVFFDL
ncbi:MAG: hypothetical protein O7E52_08685, partial [Candidatus Poribacteria bacterium]|nr:hypothetical protein [Candidatus Poribacteria bacterium]